jgi:CRISPR-associated endonuclease/helicase Cas3
LPITPCCAARASALGQQHYLAELEQLASTLDMPLEDCARRYGRLRLRADKDSDQGWLFHPALGFGHA